MQAAGVFVVAGCLFYGLALKTKDSGDVLLELGSACITGGAIAIVVLTLQHAIDDKHARRDKAREASHQFETQLLMTANLAGFDPPPKKRGVNPTGKAICASISRTPLKGGYLASKVLDGARLDALDLRSTDFRGASLRGATFRCAELAGARLISADLSLADFSAAKLARADLRGASLQDAEIAEVSDWRGAKVNTRTCWPKNFLTSPDRSIRGTLDVRPIALNVSPNLARTYGHVCGTDTVIFGDGVQRAVPLCQRPARRSPSRNQ